MNTLDGLLLLNILLDNLHRILAQMVAVLELRVVESVVAGNETTDALRFTRIDQQFLPLGHERVVAEVTADDYISALDERTQSARVGGCPLGDVDARRGCYRGGKFAGVATEAADGDVGVLEETGEHAAGEFTGDAGDADG